MTQIALSQHAWLQEPRLKALLSLLNAQGQARLVGGCVRDALLGRPIHDIDIATTLLPQQVKALLPRIGAIAAPRRADHGSVLVVYQGAVFDVTTLRRDMHTTGRHAQVAYTDNWLEDAQRRDFSINALYADAQGQVYDVLGYSLSHLATQRLSFIGDLTQRVREDYLRLLRYFRFLAQLGWEQDPVIVDALSPLVTGLCALSTQRVYEEFSKILHVPDPYPSLQGLARIPLFETLFGAPAQLNTFAHVHAQAPTLGWLARLIALCPAAEKILLSKKDRIHAQVLQRFTQSPTVSYPHLIYVYGTEKAWEVAALRQEQKLYDQALQTLGPLTFPVRSQDLPLKGPALGQALNQITQWWLEQACRPDKNACLDWFASHCNKL